MLFQGRDCGQTTGHVTFLPYSKFGSNKTKGGQVDGCVDINVTCANKISLSAM